MDANAAEPPDISPTRGTIGLEDWKETGQYPTRLVLPISNERKAGYRRTYTFVVLRNPAYTARRGPQTIPFELTRWRTKPDERSHWITLPPLLTLGSVTTVPRESSLFDKTGPCYELREGDVFPYYDQVLLVEKVERNQATVALVTDKIPAEFRPGPKVRVLPMNLQNAALFWYRTPYQDGSKTLSVEAHDLVTVPRIDPKSGEADIRLTPTTQIGVAPKGAKPTVITVAKGGLLSAHEVTYKVVNVVPPQDVKDVGHVVGWVELAAEPVAEIQSKR
jgi:hypothetical protein